MLANGVALVVAKGPVILAGTCRRYAGATTTVARIHVLHMPLTIASYSNTLVGCPMLPCYCACSL